MNQSTSQTLISLPASQLHILQHSLGLDRYGRGTMYRNHFVAGAKDVASCDALAELGLMTRSEGSVLTGGCPAFFVTEAGKRVAVAISEKPPKLTRSQRRYQQWLDADGGMSFGQYLKSH